MRSPMKSIARVFLILTTLLLSSTASATKTPKCSAFLQAYLLWSDKVEGKIVQKHSEFPLVDWDPDSQYHGVVLAKPAGEKLKGPSLEVDFQSNNKAISKKVSFSEISPLEQDASLKTFNFDPEEFFTFDRAGHYTIRLKSDGKLICEEKFKYNLGH